MSAPDILSVRVPFHTVRRGGRKLIVVPEGSQPLVAREPEADVDPVLLKAVIRAWRWRRAIETGRAASITEVAEREGLSEPFVRRMLSLTVLAPDILEAVLDGRQPRDLTLQKTLGSFSPLWPEQRSNYAFGSLSADLKVCSV